MIGVGMLVGPWALKSLISIEKIQLGMILAIFNGNPGATIISCYSPTNVREETDLINFYNELSYDKTDCISHSTNTLGKGMNPIILPPAMGK